MTATIDATGLSIQTHEQIFEEQVTALAAALDLEPADIVRMREDARSTLGQLVRVFSELESIHQESLLRVYDTISIVSEGAALERTARLLGVLRRPAAKSRVTGDALGTSSTSIPDGTRLRYAPEGTIWEVVDGPYTIGGGGSVEITLEAEDAAAHEVAVDPDTGFDDWEILDTITGFTGFEAQSMDVIGSAIEIDAALRQRAEIEAFRRAQGPLKAIEAAVSAVNGVTYVRAYDNRSLVTNADGLPGKSINLVVVGGNEQDIAEAHFRARPAGAELFGLSGATLVTRTVVDDYGFGHTVRFNRVQDITLWIRATLTISTSETQAPPDVDTAVEALLLEQAPLLFGIGDDVLPWKLTGAIFESGIPGIDNVVITLSLTGSGYSGAKQAISIRQQAVFDAARIEVLLT